jgi:hypothetical protein
VNRVVWKREENNFFRQNLNPSNGLGNLQNVIYLLTQLFHLFIDNFWIIQVGTAEYYSLRI